MPAQSGSRKQSTQVTSRDARVISTVRLFRQSWQSLIDDMKERMTTTIEPETVFQLLEQSPILEYIASLSTVYPQFTDTERRVLALQRLQLHHNEVLEFLRGCDIDAQEFLDELASKLQGLGAPDPDNVDTMI